MKLIPFVRKPNGFCDTLVRACRFEMPREGQPPVVAEAHFPKTVDDWATALRSLFSVSELGLPADEARFFIRKFLTILSSCQERRLAEYEACSWSQFIEADGQTAAYQMLLGEGVVR